jgi:hypothetical protein
MGYTYIHISKAHLVIYNVKKKRGTEWVKKKPYGICHILMYFDYFL